MRLKTCDPSVHFFCRENADRMYRFTQLAVELNEDEPNVAPTDSRRRPDQRLMEEGLWEAANRVKEELEERQRVARKQRAHDGWLLVFCTHIGERNNRFFFVTTQLFSDSSSVDYKPAWFEKRDDELTNTHIYAFTNEYWRCKSAKDWRRCPSLF